MRDQLSRSICDMLNRWFESSCSLELSFNVRHLVFFGRCVNSVVAGGNGWITRILSSRCFSGVLTWLFFEKIFYMYLGGRQLPIDVQVHLNISSKLLDAKPSFRLCTTLSLLSSDTWQSQSADLRPALVRPIRSSEYFKIWMFSPVQNPNHLATVPFMISFLFLNRLIFFN